MAIAHQHIRSGDSSHPAHRYSAPDMWNSSGPYCRSSDTWLLTRCTPVGVVQRTSFHHENTPTTTKSTHDTPRTTHNTLEPSKESMMIIENDARKGHAIKKNTCLMHKTNKNWLATQNRSQGTSQCTRKEYSRILKCCTRQQIHVFLHHTPCRAQRTNGVLMLRFPLHPAEKARV